MNLLAHGIDLVSIAKFARLVESDAYVERCFTASEQRHCGGQPDRLAARFAAKEAVLKALGIGIADGISLKDVEIVFDSGIPGVRLRNLAQATAEARGIESWLLSFAHTLDHAVASAIGVGSK